jgi:hypothetical protein
VAAVADLLAEDFLGNLLKRTRLSSVFGDFATVEKVDFTFRKILNLTFTEHKILCLKCVDDLSQILLFWLL